MSKLTTTYNIKNRINDSNIINYNGDTYLLMKLDKNNGNKNGNRPVYPLNSSIPGPYLQSYIRLTDRFYPY